MGPFWKRGPSQQERAALVVQSLAATMFAASGGEWPEDEAAVRQLRGALVLAARAIADTKTIDVVPDDLESELKGALAELKSAQQRANAQAREQQEAREAAKVDAVSSRFAGILRATIEEWSIAPPDLDECGVHSFEPRDPTPTSAQTERMARIVVSRVAREHRVKCDLYTAKTAVLRAHAAWLHERKAGALTDVS